MKIFMLILILLPGLTLSLSAKENGLISQNFSKDKLAGSAEIIPLNQEKFSLLQEAEEQNKEEEKQELQKKSGFKAVFLSAVVPGAGEFYAESYWRSAIFATIEIAAWAGYFTYEGRGDDKDLQMRRLGDERWSEQRYWSRVYQKAVEVNIWKGDALDLDEKGIITNDNYTTQNIEKLREIESSEKMPVYFTHSLPSTKTQQYYEMIYKYLRQFGSGWVELDELGYPISYFEGGNVSITPDVSRYRSLRNKSNDLYAIAKTMGTIVLLNHLASAFDAAFSVKHYNKQFNYSFFAGQKYYAGEQVTTYGVTLAW